MILKNFVKFKLQMHIKINCVHALFIIFIQTKEQLKWDLILNFQEF